MIAPSILASSRRPVAVNGTSRREAAGRDRLDRPVVAEHDEGAGATAQDALEPVAQRGAGGDGGQGRAQAQRLVRAVDGSSRPPLGTMSCGGRRPPQASLGACPPAGAPSTARGRAGVRSRSDVEQRAPSRRRARRGPACPRWSRTRASAAPLRPRLVGTTASWNPSRAASASRCGRSRTWRSSPASPISPIATTPSGGAAPRVAEAIATATARSLAGSVSRAPPTVEAKTSWRAAGSRSAAGARRGPSRPGSESRPEVVRRGRSAACGSTSACTSASSGRRPSIVTATQVPATGRGGARRTGRSGRSPR